MRKGKGGKGREVGGRRMRVKYYTGFITPPVRACSAVLICVFYTLRGLRYSQLFSEEVACPGM